MKRADHSVNLDVDGRRTSEWILGKYSGKVWTGCMWFRIGSSGSHENGKKPSVPKKAGNFLTT
jgi:hypothetical protein